MTGGHPAGIAIRFPGGRWNYRQLAARSDTVARALRASTALVPDDLVAVVMERSPELWVASLAVWKAGGAFLLLDASHPPERVAALLRDAAPRLVLTRGVPSAAVTAAGLLSLDVLGPRR